MGNTDQFRLQIVHELVQTPLIKKGRIGWVGWVTTYMAGPGVSHDEPTRRSSSFQL